MTPEQEQAALANLTVNDQTQGALLWPENPFLGIMQHRLTLDDELLDLDAMHPGLYGRRLAMIVAQTNAELVLRGDQLVLHGYGPEGELVELKAVELKPAKVSAIQALLQPNANIPEVQRQLVQTHYGIDPDTLGRVRLADYNELVQATGLVDFLLALSPTVGEQLL